MSSVLIIDDHPIVVQGCRRILEDMGIATIYDASDLASAYRAYRRHRPDVVILDLVMAHGGLSGLKLIERLRSFDRNSRILVFSMHRDPIIVARALEAGALGYAQKDSSSSELSNALEKVFAGQPYMSHNLAMEVAMLGTRAKADPLNDLTPRELEILALLAEGKTYRTIAETLSVSYKTVVNSSAQIKHKLGVNTLSELVRTAVEHLSSALGRNGRR